jgi:hypothetical protein
MGVSSGTSDGNASTAPLARRSATAVENNDKTILLIPSSFFSEAEVEFSGLAHLYPSACLENAPYSES